MTLLRQFARFAAVGVANTAVGLATIWLAMLLGLGPVLANATGYLVGVALGFALNRAWTFAARERPGLLVPRYLAAAAVAWLLNLAIVISAISYLRANAYLAQPLGIGAYALTLFVASKWLVFREARSAPAT